MFNLSSPCGYDRPNYSTSTTLFSTHLGVNNPSGRFQFLMYPFHIFINLSNWYIQHICIGPYNLISLTKCTVKWTSYPIILVAIAITLSTSLESFDKVLWISVQFQVVTWSQIQYLDPVRNTTINQIVGDILIQTYSFAATWKMLSIVP